RPHLLRELGEEFPAVRVLHVGQRGVELPARVACRLLQYAEELLEGTEAIRQELLLFRHLELVLVEQLLHLRAALLQRRPPLARFLEELRLALAVLYEFLLAALVLPVLP